MDWFDFDVDELLRILGKAVLGVVVGAALVAIAVAGPFIFGAVGLTVASWLSDKNSIFAIGVVLAVGAVYGGDRWRRRRW